MSRLSAINAVIGCADLAYGRPGAAIVGTPGAYRPPGEYAVVDMISSASPWGAAVNTVVAGSAFSENVERLIEGVISVNFYRGDAHDVANKFVTISSSENARRLFYNASIGVTRVSDIRNLDTIVRGEVERRAQIDIYVNYKTTSSSDAGVIDSVEISGEIQ